MFFFPVFVFGTVFFYLAAKTLAKPPAPISFSILYFLEISRINISQ